MGLSMGCDGLLGGARRRTGTDRQMEWEERIYLTQLLSDDNGTISVMTATLLYLVGSCERHFFFFSFLFFFLRRESATSLVHL